MIEQLLASRKRLTPPGGVPLVRPDEAAEGGCGVIGLACSEPVAGRHLLQALTQMRNRGNGKGGGIAAVGLQPEAFDVSRKVLEQDYFLVVAYLDENARGEVEQQYVFPTFEVDAVHEFPHLDDFRALEGLEVRPPEVVGYFVRVRPDVATDFAREHGLDALSRRALEDEVVYQNSYRLNTAFYASTGEKRAFVLSHGKNLLVLKMVGYGDDVVRYYRLEDFRAHVWIGHHRYPTKGRVWHPGGAHPFIGLNEALVHNGDFANYASVSEYLSQRNIYPLFLTDTEVSVQMFDLLHRVYGYPLEYVIEALAPTTERDFAQLPPEKQRVYRMLQATHIHGSPDGPWFFLIAQSAPRGMGSEAYRLIGITDTSMLRPQVFALQQAGPDGPAIGLAASEKQGIDAALESLAAADDRFWPRADRYWNARGGSHTDGGAFLFSVIPGQGGAPARLVCTDKFGRLVSEPTDRPPYRPNGHTPHPASLPDGEDWFTWLVERIPTWDYDQVQAHLAALAAAAQVDARRPRVLETLARLMDRRYPTGMLRRSSLLTLYDTCLARVVEDVRRHPGEMTTFAAFDRPLPEPVHADQMVLVEARGFPQEGPDSLARALVALYERGFRRMVVTHARGHRFIGNGLGPNTHGVCVDVFGSSGDYLASGVDGATIVVHGNAQDQLAQIMKSGRLVVYGDVGQTFGYAAKGGEVFILGNAAGRPMINAVGRPKVVINGTCLDYLAESFMAGDPLHGGGFVVLNGVYLDDDGAIHELDTPYPGGNLFSLASGGAIYVRDPHRRLTKDQLNGGEFAPLSPEDWALIQPYLEENERLFGIPLTALLTVDGEPRPPEAVYRKIQPVRVRALQAEEAWVAH